MACPVLARPEVEVKPVAEQAQHTPSTSVPSGGDPWNDAKWQGYKWTVYRGVAYDLTSFIDRHPAGACGEGGQGFACLCLGQRPAFNFLLPWPGVGTWIAGSLKWGFRLPLCTLRLTLRLLPNNHDSVEASV